ncbi:MAG: hypothetical protein KBI01_10350 [Oscillospiraceae bacterium]|nr:hypothetical protein [Oscillospiraceae bacterium]
MQANNDIRKTAKEKNIKLWQIADRYGYTDSTFSRKLRKELPDAEKAHIMQIVEELSDESD